MAEEKKIAEKVQVTSGKDTAAFVAAKPTTAETPAADAPKDLGPTAEEAAAHRKRLDEMEADFRRRRAELEAQESEMLRQAKEKAEEVFRATARDAAAKVDPDHPTNSRGKPIPVDEIAPQGVRHISEIGDSYNGKPDTLGD